MKILLPWIHHFRWIILPFWWIFTMNHPILLNIFKPFYYIIPRENYLIFEWRFFFSTFWGVFDLKMKSWSFLKVQHRVQNSRHLVEVEPFGWCLRVTINLYLQGSVPTPSHFPQVKGQPNARAGKTLHTADCLPRKRWWDHHTPWLIWKSGQGFPEKWSLGFLHNCFKSFQWRS